MGIVNKKKHYNPNIQIQAMKSNYPQFRSIVKGDDIEFIGELTVKPEFPKYTVSITYRGNLRPLVRILSPVLVEKPIHFYHESKSLCLYHPKDYKWSHGKLIAKDIVPWTAGWIYFYEVWLETGKWLGPEAEHIKNNKKDE
jgi:hypothetical protein